MESSTADRPDVAPNAALPLVLFLMCIAVAIPFAVLPVPASYDYPNHLTRMWLIAGGVREAPLSAIFAVDWTGALTNVGIDYFAALFGPVFGAPAVGALLFWLAAILPPLGAAVLNRVVFRRWSLWQPAIFLLAFPATLIAGFLNFQIALGLALLAAAWTARAGSTQATGPRRILLPAVHMLISMLLLFVHIFGLFFFCALLMALVAGQRRPEPAVRRVAWLRGRAGTLVATFAPVLVAPALVLAAAPSLPGAHTDVQGNAPLWHLAPMDKLLTLFTPFGTFDWRVDALSLAAFALPLLIAILARWSATHFGLLLACAILLAIAVIAPQKIAGTWWIEERFPPMAALALAAGIDPFRQAPGRTRALIGVFLTTAALMRAAWIGDVWRERSQDVVSVARAVAEVAPGSALLPVDISERSRSGCAVRGRWFHSVHPTFASYPVLATMWRKAFVPNIFWAAGKQPLKVHAPWNEISIPEDTLYPLHALASPQRLPRHLRDWRRRFDFILVMNGDCGIAGVPLAEGLVLERDEGFARLYRVERQH